MIDSMMHASCMLDTSGHKHSLGICNNCCFSITTVVAQTRVNVMLYLHCLSFLYLDDQSDFATVSLQVTKGKGKSIPLQALTGPEFSRRLKLPDFKTIGT
jgi:hypothetical protein